MARPIAVDPRPGTHLNQAGDTPSMHPTLIEIGALTNSYCLYVWSSGVADAISAAGGWLFDRAMAGWTVTIVALDAPADRHVSALQILGVTATTRGELPDPHSFRPFGIAVLADLYVEDPDMRSLIDRNHARAGERWIVGDIPDIGTTTTTQLSPEPHQLSRAARAFKRAALGAAQRDDEPHTATESLHCVLLNQSSRTHHIPSSGLPRA
jgi:hypothetical protein